jgi:acylphosphatase
MADLAMSTSRQLVRKRIRVVGRVQGVGFRYFAWSVGRNLGVAGFVRNEPDGAVLCEVEGIGAAVAQFVDLVGKGPAHARVDAVEVTEQTPRGGEGTFDIDPGGR